MIVLKMRKPFLYNLFFIPYNGFMWVSTVSISTGYTAPTEYQTLGYSFDEYNTTRLELGQVYIDNVEYTNANSITACESLEFSWYFDTGNQKLYVHGDHTKRLQSCDFDSLQIQGYSSDAVFYDSNNIKYLPLVLSSTTISDSVDRLEYEKMSFISNSVTFDNSEGDFDYTFTTPVPGADVNILYISQDDLDAGKNTLTPVYTGYVESEDIDGTNYIVSVADKREQLNSLYPKTFFNSTDYPNIDDDLIGDLIYEGYGDQPSWPAFCTNGAVTTGDVTYKYSTDGTALNAVYVLDDDSVWQEVTPTASDAEACTFTLSSTDGRDSSDNPREAKVDCYLRSQTNPADIIADLLYRSNGYTFIQDFYNIYDWSDERALLSDVSFGLKEQDELFTFFESLQSLSTVGFIFRVGVSGKFVIKVDDITRAVCCDVPYIHNLNDTRDVTTDFTKYATSVVINYNKNEQADTYDSVTLDTYYDETFSTYRIEKEETFTSGLMSLEDATIKGNAILKDYKKARSSHKIILDGIIPAPLLDVYKYDSSMYIKGVKVREYAGIVKFKVSDYEFDFDNEQTTLIGYDISEIVSKGTEVLTQGYMYGSYMYGDTAYYGLTETFQPEVG
jgi:hypothetical protein